MMEKYHFLIIFLFLMSSLINGLKEVKYHLFLDNIIL